MDQTTRDEIAKRLKDKGAVLPCPRCGNKSFFVIDGYFNQTLQEELQGLVIGGHSIPSAIVACGNCGFMSQHALGALDLLPNPKKEKSDDKQ